MKVGINPVAFYAVDSETFVTIANAVTIVEGNAMRKFYADGVVSGSNDLTNLLTSGFRCLPVGHVGGATMQEVVGLSAVEGFGWVGSKVVVIDGWSRCMCQCRIVIYQLVKQLAIICDDVGDIIAVFQSTFNLESSYTSFD